MISILIDSIKRSARLISVGIITIILGVFSCIRCSSPKTPTKGQNPNLVLIVSDDVGWADVGYHGGDIWTPNIDRLAEQGVRLEHFYVCPLCTPTRAGLMTGSYGIRFGMQRATCPPESPYGIPTGIETLPEMLARAGYKRRGMFGKWHLGHRYRKFTPNGQGFTHFYGHYTGSIDHFTHKRDDELDWHRQYESSYDKGYSTDLISNEAVRFIQESPVNEPFFLYVPFNVPHKPLQVPQEYIDQYVHMVKEDASPAEQKRQKRRQIYAGMVTCMDEAIGRILDIIDSKGIADNTLVFFLNDNGGPLDAANNAPLRGDKATLWEGGIRVPAIIRWQKGGLVGGRKVNDFLCYIDVYPTFKRIVGLTEPAPHHVDGIDMLDILRGEATAPGREFYSYHDRAADDELLAINTPEWKLIRRGPAILEVDQGGEALIELFRIAEDPYENNNVADLYPGVVKQLLDKVRAFRALRKPGGLPRQEERREDIEEGWRRPFEWKALPDS